MANPFGMKGDLNWMCTYINDAKKISGTLIDGVTTGVHFVDWNSFSYIEMSFVLDYQLMPDGWLADRVKGASAGNIGFSARWLASFTDRGLEFTQDGAQPTTSGKNNYKGKIVVSANVRLGESKPGAKTPFVEMAVALVAGYEDDGVQFGLSKGPVSIGGSWGGSKAGGAVEYPLRINFSTVQPAVPVKAPVAAPKPIPQIPPSLLTPAPILFEEDQDTLSQLSTRQLHEWVSVVKDHQYLGIVIANGTVPLQIQAFASTTGTAEYNKGETDRRLRSVEKILQNAQYFGSSALKFEEQSHGLEKADGVGPANAFNRRVEIKIDESKAKKAGERLLTSGNQQSPKVAALKGPDLLRHFWSNVVGGAGSSRADDGKGAIA